MIQKTFRFPPASTAIPNGITRVFVYDHATYFAARELLASSARRFLPCNCNRFEYRTLEHLGLQTIWIHVEELCKSLLNLVTQCICAIKRKVRKKILYPSHRSVYKLKKVFNLNRSRVCRLALFLFETTGLKLLRLRGLSTLDLPFDSREGKGKGRWKGLIRIRELVLSIVGARASAEIS